MKRVLGKFWSYLWLLLWAAAVMAATFRAEAAEPIRVAILDTGLDVADKRFNVCSGGFRSFVGGASTMDEHGHGTHIAGIITALTERRACLLICKYYSDANPGAVNLRNTVQCLRWAKEQRADYVNYSGGGPEAAPDELAALEALRDPDAGVSIGPHRPGAQIIVAAGNEHADLSIKENAYYPGSYHLPGVHVVASTEVYGRLAPTSNYGPGVTDFALGDNVFSSLPNERSGYMGGTSQATAVVTGSLVRARLGLPTLRSKHDLSCYLLRYWKPKDFKCP